MNLSPLYCLTFVTFVIFILFFPTSEGLLKEIFGSSFLIGDAGIAVSSLKCSTLGNNFTRFNLYKKSRPNEPFPLSTKYCSNIQKNTGFNVTIPTKVIIHGFLDSLQLSDWMLKLKNILLVEGDYNVIVMDWSCANGFPYFKAVRNSKIAASHLHELLLCLKEQGANFADFHLIGHSLGSQIAGVVGYKIPKLGRISALDPAGPMFYNVDASERLDPSDALFVDVIHTDGGNNLFEGLGLIKHVGHLDFYPNGGQTQPGCHSSPFDIVQKFGFGRTARYYLTCDHFRAIYFYIDSIEQEISIRRGVQQCRYVGIKCRDWETFAEGRCIQCSNPEKCAVMGYYSNKYSLNNADENVNNFYLLTADEKPYCVYQYGIVLETGTRNSRQISHNNSCGIITLDIVNNDGNSIKLKLNKRDENCLQAERNYTYLITSKSKIQDIESASLRQETAQKLTKISYSNFQSNFKINKMEISLITPLKAKKSIRSLKLQLNKIILCGKKDNILIADKWIKLSTNYC